MLGFQFNSVAAWISREFGDACLEQVVGAWQKRVEPQHTVELPTLPLNSSCPFADGMMQG